MTWNDLLVHASLLGSVVSYGTMPTKVALLDIIAFRWIMSRNVWNSQLDCKQFYSCLL